MVRTTRKRRTKIYNAEDVRVILTTFAEEFLVDVPARHTPDGDYLIEHDELVRALSLAEPEWYETVADEANENVRLFNIAN